MTTQANHKRNMRDAEVEVLDAEKWASLAWLDGKAYPANELTEDWKKVLFNQFHDLAAGSGIGVIYKDAQKDYDVVRWSTNEISSGALGGIAEGIDTGGEGIPLVVFNPLPWGRWGQIKIRARVPYQQGYHFRLVSPHDTSNAYLPSHVSWNKEPGVAEMDAEVFADALGYQVYHLITEPDNVGYRGGSIEWEAEARETPSTIQLLQNFGTQLTIDKTTGCITSLRWSLGPPRGIPGGLHPNENAAKATQTPPADSETIAQGGCGNQLQFFKDTPKDYDAWNIDPGTLEVPPAVIDKPDSVELLDGKTSHPEVRVTRHWQNSKFVQTISLQGDQVDIEYEIDWHETHVLLKAAFPLAASGPFATYEIPYGSIERPTTRDNSWEKAQFEVPAMRWADLSGPGDDGKQHGLSVINNSKYGYDAVGNVLRLTLLRSPKWPDPDADMGHHHFHYALYPHAGTWKDALTVRHGYEYNYPLTAVVTTAHAGSLPAEHSFASVSPENVVLTAVKKAEDQNGLGVNGIIWRVYEWAGKASTVEFHVPPGATGATVTNLMETPEGGPLTVTGDVVKAPIKPYEILTIRVDYPTTGSKQ
jgi:alpha-mannosidase